MKWLTVLAGITLLCSMLGISDGAKMCDNIPAGLNRLALGVDITKLSLEPTDFTEPDGYAGTVIDFTCDIGKMWKDPYDGKSYQMPDQVWNIVSVPGGWLNAVTRVYKYYSDVKEQMAANAGVGLISGMFSSSASYKTMSESITNKSMYISDVSSFVSTTQAEFLPAEILGLNDVGYYFVNQLPDSFMDDPQPYYDFISYFGTHYFAKGKFGGYIRNYFQTGSAYYLTHTESDLETQAQGSFFNLLKADGGYNGATFQVEEQFTSNTISSVIYYGGDTNLLQTDGLPSWQPTVPGNPWIFGGNLLPIYRMVNDSKKQVQMELATQAHLDQAFLEEISSMLYSAMIRYQWGNTTVIASLLSQASLLSKPIIPDHEAVATLGSQVRYQLQPPTWWPESQFCYRYYADGDGGQCTGPRSPLCASPDHYTVYYRDDTDGRAGGCQMSWGIMAPPVIDPWFDNVQVCFRYKPNADGGQCGIGHSQEFCAPVNSYTPYYRDDSDDRQGGCEESWMLKVPLDGPTWLLNTQLCFNWYADGNSNQCGRGVKQELCAVANIWTEYYLDDTDGSDGGCNMRWSLQDSLE